MQQPGDAIIDILICSVPSGIINRPPAAPALLKACVIQAGGTAKTIDLSLELFINQCHSDYSIYEQITSLFEPYNTWQEDLLIEQWVNQTLDFFQQNPSRYIALSVFSPFQHRATVLLCKLIRNNFPNRKIILGGYGLPEPCRDTLKTFTEEKINIFETFDSYVKKQNLADYCIIGEGESQLVDLLTNRLPINEVVDLETVPPGNFDDYKLNSYLWHNEPVLLITGSKGCVRSCTFCNVPRKFGRFRRKSGSCIANELINLANKYNITKFEFTDSLVNGSQKDFNEFVTLLAEYNSTASTPITWYGQYICRPQSQIPNGIYKKIKQSGALNLIIGAESGSNDVLEAMNKKITVQDMLEELQKFQEHGLQAQLLVLGGFYNETWDRFLETLAFIVDCQQYLASGTVTRIAVGFPLIIESGGYLHTHADELGIILDPRNNRNWTVKNDPSNTWLERIRRRIIAQVLLNKMNVSMTGNGISELKQMLEELNAYEQQFRSPNTSVNTRTLKINVH